MWTTSMLKILTWILSTDPMLRKQHNMLNAQFAACFKCMTTLNIRLQELTIHKYYFTATTYCLSFLFSYEIWNAFPFIYVSICTVKTFFGKWKIKSNNFYKQIVRVYRLVFLLLFFTETGLGWNGPLPLKFRNKN